MEINMRYKISHALVQFGGDVILRDVNFEVTKRLWKDHAAASDRGRYFDE